MVVLAEDLGPGLRKLSEQKAGVSSMLTLLRISTRRKEPGRWRRQVVS
jgi:hypothetical protein